MPIAAAERTTSRFVDDAPPLIAAAGAAAVFAWEEFLYAAVRNPHTRRSYERASRRFLTWADATRKPLHRITPADVGHYLDGLTGSAASKKVYLAAIRHLFDRLVQRHAVALNPAASVRGDRHSVVEGRTPEITVAQARQLLASIDDRRLIGLRDRAAIAVLIYTAARVGAVARLRIDDFCEMGDQFCLSFSEKGGKVREIPVRHDLQRLLSGLIEARHSAGNLGGPPGSGSPLFTSAIRRTGRLSDRPMSADDVSRMVRRRLKDAGLPRRLTAHSFRVATITDLLSQGVPLEDVQNLAGHADPRTTRLYDRRGRCVTRNIVERISI
ncbi:tyrosine-type recombinase/integrase [Botrimarina mediterranea]|uniref:tyrosine-type recombinase/integrase n=1 Tax=Botrimarina mediterranea TaxID=2528022 RepID=UPI001E62D603|nr:tyrosine-type recombinase/integrase [Botrimarina mediterranea]